MRKQVKILHIFGSMARGGAEMRTLDLMRHVDRDTYRMDYCCLSGVAGELEGEIEHLGGHFHLTKLDWRFPYTFPQLLRHHDYDVVHSHIHYSSGLVLRLAKAAGVRGRIAHFRSTADPRRTRNLRRKLQERVMRRWIDHNATKILAVSQGAMSEAWGSDWVSDKRCQVVYNGIDTTAYAGTLDAESVRAELDLPAQATMYIHIGRMDVPKNHARLLSIFHHIVAEDPHAYLCLVGRGGNDIEQRLHHQIAELHLAEKVKFLGVRDDIPRLLKAADLMLFPSLWEGLPGAVLEAAAAGTPVLATDLQVIAEITLHLPLVHTLSLEASDSAWATQAVMLSGEPKSPETRERARQAIASSVFSIDACAQTMSSIWMDALRSV